MDDCFWSMQLKALPALPTTFYSTSGVMIIDLAIQGSTNQQQLPKCSCKYLAIKSYRIETEAATGGVL